MNNPLVQTLTPRPLTAEFFAPFGQVIEIPAADAVYQTINCSTCRRYDALAEVDVSGTAGISIFSAVAREFPFQINLLERHPLGSQAFMPLGEANFIIAVAPDGHDNAPDWNNIQVFKAVSGQGVNFYRNVWHHPLLAIGNKGDFLVVDRLGGEDSVGNENLIEINAPTDSMLQIVL
ncbi:MAG: ureidoglycolate lyase [Proteobacteria bacterium]|nr:ureidoglycolate lyase [Pseudomonadota bacterium]